MTANGSSDDWAPKSSFTDISNEILPWVIAHQALPPPYNTDPLYVVVYSLLDLIHSFGRSPQTRLAAIKEYNDRALGKSVAPAVTPDGSLTDEFDLTLLTIDERTELTRLLTKAKKDDKL